MLKNNNNYNYNDANKHKNDLDNVDDNAVYIENNNNKNITNQYIILSHFWAIKVRLLQ